MADDTIIPIELIVIIVILAVLVVIPLTIFCCSKCCCGVIGFCDDYKQHKKRRRRLSTSSADASTAGKSKTSSVYMAEKLAVVEGHSRLERETGMQLEDYPYIIDYAPGVAVPGLSGFMPTLVRPRTDTPESDQSEGDGGTTASLRTPSPTKSPHNEPSDTCVVNMDEDAVDYGSGDYETVPLIPVNSVDDYSIPVVNPVVMAPLAHAAPVHTRQPDDVVTSSPIPPKDTESGDYSVIPMDDNTTDMPLIQYDVENETSFSPPQPSPQPIYTKLTKPATPTPEQQTSQPTGVAGLESSAPVMDDQPDVETISSASSHTTAESDVTSESSLELSPPALPLRNYEPRDFDPTEPAAKVQRVPSPPDQEIVEHVNLQQEPASAQGLPVHLPKIAPEITPRKLELTTQPKPVTPPISPRSESSPQVSLSRSHTSSESSEELNNSPSFTNRATLPRPFMMPPSTVPIEIDLLDEGPNDQQVDEVTPYDEELLSVHSDEESDPVADTQSSPVMFKALSSPAIHRQTSPEPSILEHSVSVEPQLLRQDSEPALPAPVSMEPTLSVPDMKPARSDLSMDDLIAALSTYQPPKEEDPTSDPSVSDEENEEQQPVSDETEDQMSPKVLNMPSIDTQFSSLTPVVLTSAESEAAPEYEDDQIDDSEHQPMNLSLSRDPGSMGVLIDKEVEPEPLADELFSEPEEPAPTFTWSTLPKPVTMRAPSEVKVNTKKPEEVQSEPVEPVQEVVNEPQVYVPVNQELVMPLEEPTPSFSWSTLPKPAVLTPPITDNKPTEDPFNDSSSKVDAKTSEEKRPDTVDLSEVEPERETPKSQANLVEPEESDPVKESVVEPKPVPAVAFSAASVIPSVKTPAPKPLSTYIPQTSCELSSDESDDSVEIIAESDVIPDYQAEVQETQQAELDQSDSASEAEEEIFEEAELVKSEEIPEVKSKIDEPTDCLAEPQEITTDEPSEPAPPSIPPVTDDIISDTPSIASDPIEQLILPGPSIEAMLAEPEPVPADSKPDHEDPRAAQSESSLPDDSEQAQPISEEFQEPPAQPEIISEVVPVTAMTTNKEPSLEIEPVDDQPTSQSPMSDKPEDISISPIEPTGEVTAIIVPRASPAGLESSPSPPPESNVPDVLVSDEPITDPAESNPALSTPNMPSPRVKDVDQPQPSSYTELDDSTGIPDPSDTAPDRQSESEPEIDEQPSSSTDSNDQPELSLKYQPLTEPITPPDSPSALALITSSSEPEELAQHNDAVIESEQQNEPNQLEDASSGTESSDDASEEELTHSSLLPETPSVTEPNKLPDAQPSTEGPSEASSDSEESDDETTPAPSLLQGEPLLMPQPLITESSPPEFQVVTEPETATESEESPTNELTKQISAVNEPEQQHQPEGAGRESDSSSDGSDDGPSLLHSNQTTPSITATVKLPDTKPCDEEPTTSSSESESDESVEETAPVFQPDTQPENPNPSVIEPNDHPDLQLSDEGSPATTSESEESDDETTPAPSLLQEEPLLMPQPLITKSSPPEFQVVTEPEIAAASEESPINGLTEQISAVNEPEQQHQPEEAGQESDSSSDGSDDELPQPSLLHSNQATPSITAPVELRDTKPSDEVPNTSSSESESDESAEVTAPVFQPDTQPEIPDPSVIEPNDHLELSDKGSPASTSESEESDEETTQVASSLLQDVPVLTPDTRPKDPQPLMEDSSTPELPAVTIPEKVQEIAKESEKSESETEDEQDQPSLTPNERFPDIPVITRPRSPPSIAPLTPVNAASEIPIITKPKMPPTVTEADQPLNVDIPPVSNKNVDDQQSLDKVIKEITTSQNSLSDLLDQVSPATSSGGWSLHGSMPNLVDEAQPTLHAIAESPTIDSSASNSIRNSLSSVNGSLPSLSGSLDLRPLNLTVNNEPDSATEPTMPVSDEEDCEPDIFHAPDQLELDWPGLPSGPPISVSVDEDRSVLRAPSPDSPVGSTDSDERASSSAASNSDNMAYEE